MADFYKKQLINCRNFLLARKNKISDFDDVYIYEGFCDALKGRIFNEKRYIELAQKYGCSKIWIYVAAYNDIKQHISTFIQAGGNPKELAEICPKCEQEIIPVYEEQDIARANLQSACIILHK